MRHVKIGDTTWPDPYDGRGNEIRWTLQYGKPTKSELLVAASVMSAYSALCKLTSRRRAEIVRAMRKANP